MSEVTSLMAIEKGNQAGHGTATVADAVLVLRQHLCKGAAVTLNRLENAVVAEASSAVTLGENDALDLAFKQMHFIALQQDYSSAKTSGALAHTLQLGQHFVDVGLAVMSRTSIAC